MSTNAPTPSPADVTHSVKFNAGNNHEVQFEFTFRMDGTGTCEDLDYASDPIPFTWDPAILEEIGPEDDLQEVLEDHARELFWDEINRELEDPVLTEDDWGSEELTFEGGSSEELEEIVRLTLYNFPELWNDDRDEIDIVIYARTESEPASVSEYCDLMEDGEISSEVKQSISDLIGLSFNWIDPYGWTLEYNDGASERSSGYSESANSIDFTISRPSFHELAEAREQLLDLFDEHEMRQRASEYLPDGG